MQVHLDKVVATDYHENEFSDLFLEFMITNAALSVFDSPSKGKIYFHDFRLIGYCCYFQYKGSLILGDVVVAKDCRRQGLGRHIVEDIHALAAKRKCHSLVALIPPDANDAQAFARAVGFKATLMPEGDDNIFTKFELHVH